MKIVKIPIENGKSTFIALENVIQFYLGMTNFVIIYLSDGSYIAADILLQDFCDLFEGDIEVMRRLTPKLPSANVKESLN